MTARHRFELQLRRNVLRSLVVRIRLARQRRARVSIGLRLRGLRLVLS